MKNVKVEDDLWAELMKLKIELRKKTVNEVIKELMEKSK
jgi:predicted CopG family antitoxin